MKIIDHRLTSEDGEPFEFFPSPNIGGDLLPEYLIIHYTAGRNDKGAVNWLINANSKASAHLVIGRDGEITQLVPFNKIAWHAGLSTWEGRVGLNKFSIGLELDNAGKLKRKGKKWIAWFAKEYKDSQVFVGMHKNGSQQFGWHTYTEKQIEVALEISSVLIAEYNLMDVLGHDDISPGRKVDPGPAFPMQSFRAKLYGRQDDIVRKYETIVNLPIRVGPGTQHEQLPGSSLPIGTLMEIVERQGSWVLVDVLDPPEDTIDMQGWVHSRFLSRSPRKKLPHLDDKASDKF